ncbi:hypothetical protein PMAYCL1PPCAC_25618, partial [Pristionchus mayeri]
MADNSTFVLRWEINYASAVHAAGKAESGIFTGKGFRWAAACEKRKGNPGQCEVDHNEPWKCEADVTFSLFRADGTKWTSEKHALSFNADSRCCKLVPMIWSILTFPIFLVNGTIAMKFDIHITHAERGESTVDSGMFAAPSLKSN